MKAHYFLSLRKMTVPVIALFCAAWAAAGAEPPFVVEIWPGEAPEETGHIGPERTRMSPKLDHKQVEVTEQTRLITDVTKPTLTIYRPAKEYGHGDGHAHLPGRRLLGSYTGSSKARKSLPG